MVNTTFSLDDPVLEDNIHYHALRGDFNRLNGVITRRKLAVAATGPLSPGSADSAFVSFLNSRDEKGRTALHYASAGGFQQCVELLLTKGADPNSVDSKNLTGAFLVF